MPVGDAWCKHIMLPTTHNCSEHLPSGMSVKGWHVPKSAAQNSWAQSSKMLEG
jgi:hypothetical protein